MNAFLRVCLRRVCLGLCLLLAGQGAMAQISAAEAELLTRQSGLWKQLDGVVAQIQSGVLENIGKAAQPPSPQEVLRLQRAVEAAYSVDRLRAVSVKAVAAEVRSQDVPALRNWFESDLGRRITQLEEAGSAEADYLQTLAREGPVIVRGLSAQRRALLEEIVVTTRSVELTEQLMIGTTLAVHRGAMSVAPVPGAPTERELQDLLQVQLPQLRQTFAAVSLMAFARLYREIPGIDLRQYADFLASEPCQAFMAVQMRALEAALLDAAADLGRRLPGTRDQSNS